MWIIIHNKILFYLTLDDPLRVKNILSNRPSKHYHEPALMTAVHIMICWLKVKVVKKSLGDFDNLELVRVWIDYIIAIYWVYKNAADDTWVASDNGKMWIEKHYTMWNHLLL